MPLLQHNSLATQTNHETIPPATLEGNKAMQQQQSRSATQRQGLTVSLNSGVPPQPGVEPARSVQVKKQSKKCSRVTVERS